MPVVQWATARLTATIEAGWPQAPPPKARLLAEALVRLAISHVTAPADSPETTAARTGELLGPFIDEALGGRPNSKRPRGRSPAAMRWKRRPLRVPVTAFAVVDDEVLAEALALVEAVGVDVGLGRGDRHVLDAALAEACPRRPRSSAAPTPLPRRSGRTERVSSTAARSPVAHEA